MTAQQTVYVGPRPFEAKDRATFFGRDQESRDLIGLIFSHRALLLHSPSGAGKTSFLNALLVPALAEKFQILPLARVSSINDAPDQSKIRNVYLSSALASCYPKGPVPSRLANATFDEFLSMIDRGSDSYGDTLPLLIIFDQFEELFTRYPERWKDRREFFEQIGLSLKKEPLLRVVFSIREDYIGGLEPYLRLLPDQVRTYRFERLREEAALSAVVGPLRDTHVKFAPGVAMQLVQNLLRIPVKTPSGTLMVAGEFVEPVQLQLTCQRLWQSLQDSADPVITRKHLETFGDVDQALRSFYEKTIASVVTFTGIKEFRLRRWFEDILITPTGTRATIFRGPEGTGGISNAAVDQLDMQHIIRSELRGGERWYELSHDRFIKAIQKSNEVWFKHLTGAEANLVQLEEKASQWQGSGRNETELLDGAELADAERWLEGPDATELGYSDALFALVQASIAVKQARPNKRSRRMLVVSTILLTILVLLTMLAVVQRRRIEKLEQLLRQHNLTAAAEVLEHSPRTRVIKSKDADRVVAGPVDA